MRELKIATAANVMVFMTDAADHLMGKPGLTLTITASKDGAAFAAITPTVTERGNGWYNLALTTAHTDTLGDLVKHITAAGADPADIVSRIIAIDKANATTLGLTNLDAAVSTRSTYAGGAVASVTAPVTAGTVTDKTGYALSAAGLDAVTVESGLNARQALAIIDAAEAGTLSGAGTGTIVIKNPAASATRITATVDGAGNRSAITLNPPA